jgi:V/A-type H+-transporting ATPase subunit I
MKRISLLGHQSVLEESIRLLQRAGVVEVESRQADLERLERLAPDRERIARLDAAIADATFVRDLLGRFRSPDGPLGGFIPHKIHVAQAAFECLGPGPEFEELYRECEAIAERLAEIGRRRSRLQALVDDLAPWLVVPLRISEWEGTEHVTLFTGTVPQRTSGGIRQTLRESVQLVSVAEVGRAREREAWVVMAHCSAADHARSVLAGAEFEEVHFPGLLDSPVVERARAVATLAKLEAEEKDIKQRAGVLAAERYGYAVTLVQALLTRKDAEEVRERLAASERTFLVTGWVPVRRMDELAATMAPLAASVDLTFDDPGPDDIVPVALDNPAPLRPFEVLTDLYGRPRYGEIDPTPLLAGFFFLFFGKTMGDVGYGLMLVGGAWFIKQRLDVTPGVRKFMDLLMMGGVASMIVGATTRSYFALPEDALPSLLRYQPLIDPLGQLELVLVMSVVLGVLHVSFALAVNAYQRIRHGDAVGALSDEGTSLGLFAAIGAAVALPDLAMPILGGAFALAVVLKGRVVQAALIRRSPVRSVLSVGRGLVGLYGLVGYATDFLSYTRLAALGLASMLVGDVINRLARLVSEIPFGVGVVAAVLIMVGGHTFNVLINLLGGFIHSMRLQFIEFFGKFYEGTGRRFAPFAPRTKSLVLHADTIRPQEGAY